MNDAKSDAKAASRGSFRGDWAAVATSFKPDLSIDDATRAAAE